MGLNIKAYAKLETIKDQDIEFNEYHDPINHRIVSLYFNPHYPTHPAGLKMSNFFICRGEEFKFRAGSYHGYNEWRDWLATLAGFKNAKEVWNNPTMGHFVELINFSDCEGTIGSIISSKLAKDFKDLELEAKKYEKTYPFHYRLYQDWKKCFEVAAKDGAVSFH